MASRRHRPSAGTRDPASHDWDDLAYEVTKAAILRMANPTKPLLKIGKFEAIVDVGRGGFGIVFKARDPELDRLVALKLCRARPSAIKALLDEAKLQAKLDRYPNIVTIYDQGHHDGAAFIAMQFIAGENAERFAERKPAPSVREILRVYLHVARGLKAAHAEGILHRDIKPSNVLLDCDDFARIADFGLGQRLIEDADESEQEGLRRRAGTLYYMAPEALCGKPCDARSDQFSFFVALCQTLARGKLPFYGKSSGAVLEAIEHTDILQFLGPWVPAELKALIRIGLSLDPDERFPDMATVEAEIDRLLQILPPSSPPDEPEPDESDEPESDESESDEFDEPDRMHEPESSDVPALVLGDSPPLEPEVIVNELPTLEPEVIVNELPPLEPEVIVGEPQPELTPLGGGPAPSKAPRGVLSASLLLAVGLTLGWLGHAQTVPRPSEPSSSTRELKKPRAPALRSWTEGLASYSRALQAIDRGDYRAGYDAWVSGHFDVSRSTPRIDGELSLLLAERVDERSPSNPDASWMANGAAESFELAQSWRRAAEARKVAAELARAANHEWEVDHQERCVLVNAMGQRCR